jgi:oligopeptide/dipeptide ABC transporter ATP-binding protein
MSDHLLDIVGLWTVFVSDEGTAAAVSDLNLHLDQGETIGIVGESGCGKSVTALSIMRLISSPGRIEKGNIEFLGTDLLKLSEPEMRAIRGNDISMIFQEPMTSLNPVLKVGDQIGEVYRLHRGLTKRDAWNASIEMMQKVGIPSPEQRVRDYPHQMSGGMRQRVMIAMALACDPSLMLADEPTTALDVTIQAQILELMNEIKKQKGTGIVLITHDLGIVAEMAARVAVMYAGRIVEHASVKDLFLSAQHPYTVGLLKSIPRIRRERGKRTEKLPVIPGMVPDLRRLPRGCAFQDRCGEVASICSEPPELELKKSGHLVRCWKR